MTPHKFLPSLTRKQDYCGYNGCGQQESHPIHQVPWATPPTPEEAAIDKLAALFRWKTEPITEDHHAAIRRLLSIALRDTGQSRRVADFLLAWYNAEENGGWNPADLWAVDQQIADDMMLVLGLIHKGDRGKYPNDWGYRDEIQQVWKLWRKDAEGK